MAWMAQCQWRNQARLDVAAHRRRCPWGGLLDVCLLCLDEARCVRGRQFDANAEGDRVAKCLRQTVGSVHVLQRTRLT